MSGHWFKPHRYGIGAQPANWKGWAASAGFVSLMLLISVLFPPAVEDQIVWGRLLVYLMIIVALSVLFILFARSKTDGEWRWRWGGN